jgi:hypothetical protein
MAAPQNPLNNTDCGLVALVWNLLSKPESGEYYLGNIINNGLNVPSLGIDIAPFPTINIGDIPEQTMFKWALEYMGISLNSNVLSGLGTFQGGVMKCTPVSDTETSVDMTLNFGQVAFAGKYDVGVSGVSGCAIATGAAILDGISTTPSLLAFNGEESRLALASWFRDKPLEDSDNGQTMVGAYYLHQDTIQAVTTADNNYSQIYRQKLAQQKGVADDVTAANAYYRAQQEGQQPPGDAPTIGDSAQYAGGFYTYAALQMATQHLMEQQGLNLEPNDNEYAELMNSMTQFNGQVKGFQKKNPGERTTEQIMDYVDTAQPVSGEALAALTGEPQGIPIYDLKTEQIVGYRPTWPVDMAKIRTAHAARADKRRLQDDAWFNIKGSFNDVAQEVGLRVVASFSSHNDNKLYADTKTIQVTIGNLNITLAKNGDFDKHPGLYDQVAEWIANTQSFQDTLKSQLNSGINQPDFKNGLTSSLNAGLKKLGLQ